jgi:hypothetical protein
MLSKAFVPSAFLALIQMCFWKELPESSEFPRSLKKRIVPLANMERGRGHGNQSWT